MGLTSIERESPGCPACGFVARTVDEYENMPRHDCGMCNGKVEFCSDPDCGWRGGNRVGRPCTACSNEAVWGRRCKQYCLRGGRSCKSHNGTRRQAVAKQQYRLKAAEAGARAGELLEAYTDMDVEIHPMDGLLDAVQRSYAMMQAAGEMANAINEEVVDGGEAGPKVDPILDFYKQTMRDHATLCKLALDAGIDERRLGLAQNQGQRIQDIIKAFVTGMFRELTDAGVDTTTLAFFRNNRVAPLMREAFETTATPAALPPAV